MPISPESFEVYLESGQKRTVAGVLDWPGWCRIGRDEDTALSALADYQTRYAQILRGTEYAAALAVPVPTFAIVERLAGNATTDFGVPECAPAWDLTPLDAASARRYQVMLEAIWRGFDAAVGAISMGGRLAYVAGREELSGAVWPEDRQGARRRSGRCRRLHPPGRARRAGGGGARRSADEWPARRRDLARALRRPPRRLARPRPPLGDRRSRHRVIRDPLWPPRSFSLLSRSLSARGCRRCGPWPVCSSSASWLPRGLPCVIPISWQGRRASPLSLTEEESEPRRLWEVHGGRGLPVG